MNNYTIIPYDEKYRDDMIFMVFEAKDALGRIPRLNEDLLDIQKNYLDTQYMITLKDGKPNLGGEYRRFSALQTCFARRNE